MNITNEELKNWKEKELFLNKEAIEKFMKEIEEKQKNHQFHYTKSVNRERWGYCSYPFHSGLID